MRNNQTQASNSQNLNLKQGILRLIIERYYREVMISTSMLIWALFILIYPEFLQQIFQIDEYGLRFLTVVLLCVAVGVYSLICKYKQGKYQLLFSYISAFEDAKCTFPFGILLFSQDKTYIILGHFYVLLMLWHKTRHLTFNYKQHLAATSLKDTKVQNCLWVSINVFFYLKILFFFGEQNRLLENIIFSFLSVLLYIIIKIKSRKFDLSKPFYRLAFCKIGLSHFLCCYFEFVFLTSSLTQSTIIILLVLQGLNLCFMLKFRQLSQFLYFAQYQRSFCSEQNSRNQLPIKMKKNNTFRLWLLFKNCETFHKEREICHLCTEEWVDTSFFKCTHFIFCQKCMRRIIKKSTNIQWCCPVCKEMISKFITINCKDQEKIVGRFSPKWIAFAQRLKVVTNYELQNVVDHLPQN